MKTYIKITWEWDGDNLVVVDEESYEHEGPVALCCGASQQQKDIENTQQSAYQTMVQQSQQVFGNSSAVFKDLMDTFTPTVLAGPNQQGFSPAELSALKSQAITQTGNSYKNAKYAVGEAEAAQGGGNLGDVSGGSKTATDLGIASSAAEQTASEENQIDLQNYAVGRQNYSEAVSGLDKSTGVFDPVTGLDSAATSGGNAAANTANQISEQNNSWVQAVTGALGGVAGGLVTGGMSNLGKGVGFFGGGSGTNSGKSSN